MPRALSLFACGVLIFGASLARAAVTKVEISERSDLTVAGAERIAGKVYFALDPKNPANRAIVDLDRAPKNAQGLVEFSADLIMVRPKDAVKRNGTLLMEVSNRGHSSLFSLGGGGGTN